jgi:HEAT repeat protein
VAAAEDALAKVGRPAAAALAAALRHQSKEVRYRAATALGRIGPAAEERIPALAAFLRDRDWGVDFDIPAKPKGFLQVLVADSTGHGPDDRRAAALALARMGPRGVRALIDASHDDGRVNLWKAWGITRDTVGTLRDDLPDLKDQNPVMIAVSLAIQLPKLAEAAKEHDSHSRRDAVEALGSADLFEETVAALAQALTDPDADVRREAVEGLTRA